MHELPDFVKAQITVYMHTTSFYSPLQQFDQYIVVCIQDLLSITCCNDINIFALHKNKHLILAFKSTVKRD